MTRPTIFPDASAFDSLSNRAYFAAHAPEVPEWFEGEPIPVTYNPFWTIKNEDQKIVREWDANDGETELPEHLQWYPAELKKYNQDSRTYDARNQQARFFAWRVFYADMMIEEMNKTAGK